MIELELWELIHLDRSTYIAAMWTTVAFALTNKCEVTFELLKQG